MRLVPRTFPPPCPKSPSPEPVRAARRRGSCSMVRTGCHLRTARCAPGETRRSPFPDASAAGPESHLHACDTSRFDGLSPACSGFGGDVGRSCAHLRTMRLPATAMVRPAPPNSTRARTIGRSPPTHSHFEPLQAPQARHHACCCPHRCSTSATCSPSRRRASGCRRRWRC